ncbi:glutamate ABC transporter substrate-binding protein [Lactobacillus corticis]|uniref:Glutamine ABC transporter substrate-binding protein n=1 Tax=Lactobacillus corticis TaxID=2201249 RepID=A0A916QGI8_9LACO|nr:glutamate ABC transporter substrate-binding protein [Lactobacillus corticis]GFZ26574.1 glutamine ABC transporter substrate-binding protein [Lactobacillus corticis]
MRKWLKVFLAIVLGLTLAGCSSKENTASSDNEYQAIKQSKTIAWGIRTDVRLFGYVNLKTGKVEGFELDLARALTKQMLGKDGKAEFVETTAKTKIPQLLNNSVDVDLATMTITDERKKVVDFTNPYFNAGQSILVKNSSKINSIKDLNHKNIVVLAVKGTTAVQNMKKFAPKAKVQEYDDYGQAMAALKSGQGDAMTTDNGILAGLADENKGYKLVGGTFTNEPYGMAIKKNQPQLKRALNKALAELKANGTYKKLLIKWFNGVKGFSMKEAMK